MMYIGDQVTLEEEIKKWFDRVFVVREGKVYHRPVRFLSGEYSDEHIAFLNVVIDACANTFTSASLGYECEFSRDYVEFVAFSILGEYFQ